MGKWDVSLFLLIISVCFCLRVVNAQTGSGPEGKVLFSDSFKTADNWEIISGDWKAEDGTFKATGTPAHFALAGKEEWADYSFQVTTQILGSNNPQKNWLKSYLFFRVQDTKNFYRFGIHGDGKVVDLYKCVDNQWTHLANSQLISKKEKWYTLKIEVVGEKIKGYADNKLVIETEDDAFLNGRIGLGVLEDEMNTVYKDVMVRTMGEGTFSPIVITLLQRQLINKDVTVNLKSSKLTRLEPSELKAKVELFPAGSTKPVKTETVEMFNEKYRAVTKFDISKFIPGEYEIHAVLLSRGGKTLGSADAKFKVWKFPWMGSKAGTTEEVLAPWTPMEVEGEKIKCWGRTYEFFSSFLPVNIELLGSSILSGPIKLSASVNKKLVSLSECKPSIITRSGSKVVLKTSAQYDKLEVSSEVLIEYDGMVRIDLTLNPKGNVTIDALTLQIPLKKEFATLYHWPGLWGGGKFSGALPEEGLQLPFKCSLWLGNEDCGLNWFAESDEKWSNKDVNAVIKVESDSRGATMNIQFIDQPLEINSPLNYTFGLQATPVKPYPEGWRQWHITHGASYGMEKPPAPTSSNTSPLSTLDKLKRDGVNTIVFHENWTDIQNYPETTYEKELKSLVSECHRLGMKILLYFGYELADIAPEFDACYEETLRKIPGEKISGWFYTRQPPQKDYGVCYNSPWQDFLADGIQYAVDKYDIDGVYLDGTVLPWACPNYLHGCGYKDKEGKIKKTYPIFAVRALMKRLYAICTKKGGMVNVHNSTCCVAPTLSFSTSYWEGEHLQDAFKKCKKVTELLDVLPLSVFRAEFMGSNWGVPAELLVYASGKWDFNSALAITLLHGVLVRPYVHSMGKIPKIWKVMDDFGVDAKDCVWYPYWRNSELIKIAQDGTLASIYSRSKKGALLVVSNLTEEAQEIQINLNFTKLGLNSKELQIQDAITGESIPLSEDGSIKTSIGKFKCQLLLLK